MHLSQGSTEYDNVYDRLCYRRMQRISLMEHITSEDVFNKASARPIVLDRRMTFHAHLAWQAGITFDLMTGHQHGTRPTGRPGTTRLKDLTKNNKNII